ncbi:NETI motif-containing protein [Bacillus pinisoli]|uniref:NETI motif-containing protein n=1 Tax=Bacillus pinisoli TaxID=2901866 RepID=UPI001FF5ED5E|nr:NETI motif-containing protein [Bacillus pinisoli]
MDKKPSKKKFHVGENETIDQCLARMEQEGYQPVRRMEEPVFQETETNGIKDIQPFGRIIVFEGKFSGKTEH